MVGNVDLGADVLELFLQNFLFEAKKLAYDTRVARLLSTSATSSAVQTAVRAVSRVSTDLVHEIVLNNEHLFHHRLGVIRIELSLAFGDMDRSSLGQNGRGNRFAPWIVRVTWCSFDTDRSVEIIFGW